MSLNNISELSTTASSNTDFAGTSILGTGLVSTADDSFRNLGSFLAKQWSDLGAVNTVGGTANAITITTPTVYTALKTGMFVYFVGSLFNTSAVTLNLDSIGAKAVRVASDGTDIALIPGDIRAKGRYLVIYDAAANSAAGAWILFNAESASRYPPGTLYGLTLSNNGSDATNDIDIAVGACRDSSDAININLTSALTKRLDATFTAGTGNGGRFATSISDATWHKYLIINPSTGAVDAGFSTSATNPTSDPSYPSGFTFYRRIGAILRESAAIVLFNQKGDEFLRAGGLPLDVNATHPGTGAVSRTLSVPTGLNVWAMFNWLIQNSDGAVATQAYFSSLDENDNAPSTTAAPLITSAQMLNAASGVVVDSGRLKIRTNSAAQVRSRLTASNANMVVRMSTVGWWDNRGRL